MQPVDKNVDVTDVITSSGGRGVHVSRRSLFELWVPDGGVAREDFLLQQGEEPREVCQHQSSLLGRHLVLLCSELVEQLLPHGLKYRFQQRPVRYKLVISLEPVLMSYCLYISHLPKMRVVSK